MSRARIGLAVCAISLLGIAPAIAQGDPEEPPSAAPHTLIEPAQTAESATHLPPDKPFKRLFQNLYADLRRFPSKDTAVVLSIGTVLSLAAHPLDEYVTEHASAGGTDQVFAVGGGFGSGYPQAGGAVLTYVIGRITKHPTTTHVGADLIRAQVMTGLITHSVKLIARRERPGDAPGHMPATYSFPSGHASATWASATVLWRHLGWKVGVPASLLAIYVSGSRVQQNQHFPSDLLFGAALGIAAGRTITVGHNGRGLSVGPAAVPGGAAVLATLDLH